VKDPNVTLLELVNHVINSHPELRSHFKNILAGKDVMIENTRALLLNRLTEQCRSQFNQDLFVATEMQFKRGGFFVEFGATNGVDGSNTYLLEKIFNWSGILVEPGRCWHEDLIKNRGGVGNVIDTRCVSDVTGISVDFAETEVATLSTMVAHLSEIDHSSSSRNAKHKVYSVQTVSLVQLLREYKAPKVIDYLSIDTEGSEYDILKAFNFEEFRFNTITVEHNSSNRQEKIHDLLLKNGYQRKFEGVSNPDDWYVWHGSSI
jgi:FkbM family methyltransferase